MRLPRYNFAPSLLALSVATVMSFATLPAVASPEQSVASAAATLDKESGGQQASEQTQNLVALQKRWEKAQGRDKSALLEQLIAKAEARRAFLVGLMVSHPAEVLRVAIPEDKQTGMPAEVLDKLEQRLELSGKLEVFYEDHEDGSHRLRQFLNTDFGERFELHFAGNVPQLSQGQAATVSGVLLASHDDSTGSDGDFGLSADTLMLAAGSTTGGNLGGTAKNGWTFGEQKALVINVNFTDNSTQPWTQAQAQGVVSSVNDFIRENSAQRTSLTGDVTPWITLPMNGASCDTLAINQAAFDAATARGYDISSYNRLIVAMPYSSNCGFSGVGSVGGWPSSMMINGSMTLYTVAHELGHNLGLYHSHGLDCGSEVIGSSCSVDEYGDSVDIMGHMTSHYTAFQKERLGWLDDSTIQTVTQSGVYSLEPYAAAQGSAPKALKVSKGTDAATGLPAWYYVEYRQAIGFDSTFASNATVQNGVMVHTGVETKGNTSYLLDMTPGSAASSYADVRDAALVVGHQFTDTANQITLATEWTDGSTAGVNVQVDGAAPSCTRANPSLSLSPGESAWVAAGTSVSYSLTLTSRDSSACASSSYTLSKVVPSGWSSVLGSSSLTLAPGESRTTTLTVTSSSSAGDGFYPVTATAASGSYSASGSVSYVVDNPVVAVNNAPKAVNDSASTAYQTPVSINVLANDSDADGDTLTVTSLSGVNGSAVINANGSITFTPASGFSGIETFNYTVSDGSASATATVSVNVATPVITNSAPTAINDSASTAYGSAVTINVLANDSDPDGDTLTVTSLSGVNGSAVINANGSIAFTPANGFSGTETFSYTITDGKASATATVSVNVAPAPPPANRAPVALDDSAATLSGTSVVIAVLGNDSDPDGDALKVISVAEGGKGSVRINSDGTLTFTPAKNFKNFDTFSYTISDGALTATASVTVSQSSSSGDSSGSTGNGKGPNK